jgi:hypothetical protein
LVLSPGARSTRWYVEQYELTTDGASSSMQMKMQILA